MPKLKIDGHEYEFPTIESLNLDEAVTLERYAGVTIDRIEPGESFPVGALKALIIIAVRRVRADVSEREVAERIGKLKLTELDGLVEKDPEPEPDPPAPVSPGDNASIEPSGTGGRSDGDPSPARSGLNGTGQPPSGTGPASVPAISAL